MTSPITYFKNVEGTNFYHYNHLTGELLHIINDGCYRAVIRRNDSQAANIVRVYHREIEYLVPSEFALYADVTIDEFIKAFDKVQDSINDTSHAAFASF
jgi:hypothetical protein